ncbi:NAD-dependent epimerase/dehydratase family protein [Planctobacterium marinum]|uniref:NAD-dependent epimerase/dehydratase domain-containing protein n=1 Tax=Planctobacterium marinum TaxID=1631968 RepID=A0AA48HZB4_9ALTE|nr:hypothetical protein MACH26_28960 [Planctobacterium marinum]
MTALVIGCDEFLGAELTQQLLFAGETVTGLSLFPWEQSEKRTARLQTIEQNTNARHFIYVGNLGNLSDDIETRLARVQKVYFLPEFNAEIEHQEFILHLTLKVLNLCDMIRPAHLVFGSHYCIYRPSSEPICADQTGTDHPENISAAIVKAIESLLHGFCAQKQLPTTVMRIFELYGTDASEMNLVQQLKNKIEAGESCNLKELQNHQLDYVFVKDAAKILTRAMEHNARPSKSWHPQSGLLSSSFSPWHIYDLGTGQGTSMRTLITMIAQTLRQPEQTINHYSHQNNGWVADTAPLKMHMGLQARTLLAKGLAQL